VNRAEFQALAEVRIDEAGALLAAGKWDGAYYLAGYAVECALKACIAKLTRAEDFPDKDRAAKAWTHKLDELVLIARLKAPLDAEFTVNPALKRNWVTVKDWTEASRYERQPKDDAETLHAAITDPTNGVLSWIKRHW
jgi:HEPN domain-containing protein